MAYSVNSHSETGPCPQGCLRGREGGQKEGGKEKNRRGSLSVELPDLLLKRSVTARDGVCVCPTSLFWFISGQVWLREGMEGDLLGVTSTGDPE